MKEQGRIKERAGSPGRMEDDPELRVRLWAVSNDVPVLTSARSKTRNPLEVRGLHEENLRGTGHTPGKADSVSQSPKQGE